MKKYRIVKTEMYGEDKTDDGRRFASIELLLDDGNTTALLCDVPDIISPETIQSAVAEYEEDGAEDLYFRIESDDGLFPLPSIVETQYVLLLLAVNHGYSLYAEMAETAEESEEEGGPAVVITREQKQ